MPYLEGYPLCTIQSNMAFIRGGISGWTYVVPVTPDPPPDFGYVIANIDDGYMTANESVHVSVSVSYEEPHPQPTDDLAIVSGKFFLSRPMIDNIYETTIIQHTKFSIEEYLSMVETHFQGQLGLMQDENVTYVEEIVITNT